MTKRMLIDATHAEETRVVVLDGNRLEDFDVETSTKKQLKGNIYLAKIVRVEPSLQAAFVEYGGGRHGFLAFGEIHPDYYQIPVADRERLLRMQVEEARAEEAAEEAADLAAASGHPVEPVPVALPEQPPEMFSESGLPEVEPGSEADGTGAPVPQGGADETVLDLPIVTEPAPETAPRMPDLPPEELPPEQGGLIDASLIDASLPDLPEATPADAVATDGAAAEAGFGDGSFADSTPGDASVTTASFPETDGEAERGAEAESGDVETVVADAEPPETVGGESEGGEDGRERRLPARYLRNYKIQEVIRRRQILLIQVVKEERGTKGAALTTYISLAGRFSVLMPNSPRGGGISRKITSAADRRRLKEVTNELAIPEGMGLIVRTAGANRPKPEIKRDCEYLLRLWDDIRETTMASVAPALIHEEASLIKRAIRDNYSRDVDEVLVDGEEGWKQARDIMRMLMPAHARKVISWRDNPASNGQPLFASQQVEAQLDAMMSPNVQLRSGGYLVIDQTEALVAIDVNSGRSTRERGIEETALRTNLEAADEVARQLRLRDLAGLIVIDFIDMESKKHNLMVERRLKDALKIDRARIQVGQISHFGLMEMSRQRLRPSLAETSFVTCSHCGGAGQVRSTESSAIHVLRGLDEEGAKRRAAEILVHVAPVIAMYILNHKRDRLADIERRYAMQVVFEGDATMIAPQMKIDRVRAAVPVSVAEAAAPRPTAVAPAPVGEAFEASVEDDDEEDEVAAGEEVGGTDAAAATSDEASRRRRRRRRRGRREDGAPPAALPGVAELDADQPDLPQPQGAAEPVLQEATTDAPTAGEPIGGDAAEPGEAGEAPAAEEEGGDRPRRRGRRGGRRRRRDGTAETSEAEQPSGASPSAYDELPAVEPAYTGPTPANPFGGTPFDIYDVMEQAERAEQVSLSVAAASPQADAAPIDGPPDVAPAAAAPSPEAAPHEAAPHGAAPHGAVPHGAVPHEAVPHGAAPHGAAPHEAVPDEPLSDEPLSDEPRGAVPADAVHADAPIPATPPAEPSPRALHLVEPAEPEAAPEPLVKPVVIDSGAPAEERKRGWWRR